MTAGARLRAPAALAALCAALALPAAVAADDGGERGDVRRSGRCTGASEAALRLRADDGSIRIGLELETARRGGRWTVVVLHERRLVVRRALRTRADGSLRLRVSAPDWFGRDTVVARASGPGAELCRVSATL